MEMFLHIDSENWNCPTRDTSMVIKRRRRFRPPYRCVTVKGSCFTPSCCARQSSVSVLSLPPPPSHWPLLHVPAPSLLASPLRSLAPALRSSRWFPPYTVWYSGAPVRSCSPLPRRVSAGAVYAANNDALSPTWIRFFCCGGEYGSSAGPDRSDIAPVLDEQWPAARGIRARPDRTKPRSRQQSLNVLRGGVLVGNLSAVASDARARWANWLSFVEFVMFSICAQVQ